MLVKILLIPNTIISLTYSYVNYFGDINLGFAGYSRTIKESSFATGIQFADYGTFVRSDETGTKSGEFAAKDIALNIAGGRVLHDSIFTLGVNLKTVYSYYDVYSGLAMAADIGGAYHNKKKNFIVTGLIKNAGYQLKTFNNENLGLYVRQVKKRYDNCLIESNDINLINRLQSTLSLFGISTYDINSITFPIERYLNIQLTCMDYKMNKVYYIYDYGHYSLINDIYTWQFFFF